MSAFLLYASGNKNLGLTPKCLDYFNEHFIGEKMAPTWEPPSFEIDNNLGRLTDFLSWMHQAPVVSANARRVLEPMCACNVEMLPLAKIRGTQYFAVNVITLGDYIDLNKSNVVYSPVIPTKIMSIDEFVLHPSGQFPAIFKDARYRSVVFVNDRFAKLAQDAALTGVRFLEPGTSRWKVVLGKA